MRRLAVTCAFVAAIAAVLVLNARAAGSGSAPSETIHLSEVARASGIEFVHQSPTLDPKVQHIAAHIAALGAGVSVTDVDNDGWPDLYFTSSRFGAPNVLYRNNHDGTFHDVAEEAGLADLNRPGEGVSMGAVWGDYDNDGLEDLLVYKWGYPQLFHNLGHLKFEDVTAQSGLRTWMNSNSAVWIDFDHDGLLDLYITGYFRSDIDFWHLKSTRIMQESWEFASNGGKNLLFKNVGNGHFKDVTDSLGVGSTRWSHCSGLAGSADSRLLSTLRRISRHPCVVLTLVPSLLNSHSPAAALMGRADASSRRIHSSTRLPSSSQIARTVSLLIESRHSSDSFDAA